eukprot:COSAG01_NODE_13043_length_1644_cov_27.174110_2_plen_60_part_00
MRANKLLLLLFYLKVNNVFCLSLLCLLDRSYGSISSRALSDRNVLGLGGGMDLGAQGGG